MLSDRALLWNGREGEIAFGRRVAEPRTSPSRDVAARRTR